MSVIRCPQCNLPATREESASGLCPDCGAVLPLSAPEPVKVRELPAATWHLNGFLLSVAALAILLIGGGGGYCVGAFAPHDPEETPPVAAATSAELDAAVKQAKDAEAFAEKLRRDLDERKKQSLAADETRKQQDDLIKELGRQGEKLKHDADAQKKLAVAAIARAETAEKEAAARPEAGGPLNVRVKQLDALVKQQKLALDSQIKQTRDANTRADGLQRMVELVRQQGLQLTEQVRQQGQKSLEQLRQESQRQLELVRGELRKQQQMTEQARTEATKQKLAADELRRKIKP